MKKTAWLILATVLVLSVVFFFLPTDCYDAYFTLIRPGVLFFLTLTCFVMSPKIPRLDVTETISQGVCLFGTVLMIALMFVAGVVMGFAANPTVVDISKTLQNVWSYVFVVICREYLRAKIMIEKNPLIFLLVVLVFTLSFADTLNIILSYETIPLIKACLDTLLPLLVMNIFLTYVSKIGGAIGGMIFAGTYQGIYTLSPVLPNATKLLEAVIVCLCVFVMYVTIEALRWKPVLKQTTIYPWKRLAFLATGGVWLILFVFGVFRNFPLVVASHSMKGAFDRGDVVIIQKVKQEEIKNTVEIGDIIQYKNKEGIAIVHRVIDVIDNVNDRIYVTKGDNNLIKDKDPVEPEQIVGIVDYYIPYVGFPTLLLSMSSGN